MARRMAPDRPLFLLTLALLVFGLVMLYSASAIVADASDRSPSYFLGRQAVWAALGCLAMIAVARSDYRQLNRPAVVWAVYGLLIVSLFAALLSPAINGVNRWVHFAGLTLQPSEPARLGLVVALAHLMAARSAASLRTLLLPLVATGFLAGLIYLQPDLGTATLMVLVGASVIFLGGRASSTWRAWPRWGFRCLPPGCWRRTTGSPASSPSSIPSGIRWATDSS